MDLERTKGLQDWVNQQLAITHIKLHGLQNDASARKYFRLAHPQHGTLIAVDAHPETECNEAFIKVGGYLKQLGLNVPNIIAYDLTNGYLLLSDLGTQSYLQVLSNSTMTIFYQQAIDAIVLLQAQVINKSHRFAVFDQSFMLKELDYFTEWFLHKYLDFKLSAGVKKSLMICFNNVVKEVSAQPQVMIHRDYHSRNLLVTKDNNPGIIDFQDMMIGPIMYDVVSLLKDCYINWPQAEIEKLLDYYVKQAQSKGLLTGVSLQEMQRWFDWVGVQRHLKVLGVFARLKERDNKPDYLQYFPRIMEYLKMALKDYPELVVLDDLVSRLGGDALCKR